MSTARQKTTTRRSIERVVLLTGPVGAPELTRFLCLSNPRLKVAHVATRAELLALPSRSWRCARLIGFLTDVIVPRAILDVVEFGAYNFHPGPPSYPGWAPAFFAIHDGARIFGATSHRMIERVDAGPIIGIELFPLLPDHHPSQLEREAHIAALHLFKRLGPTLATCPEPLPVQPIVWGKPKRRRADLAKILPDIGLPDRKEGAPVERSWP
jgi:hypothetical protein